MPRVRLGVTVGLDAHTVRSEAEMHDWKLTPILIAGTSRWSYREPERRSRATPPRIGILSRTVKVIRRRFVIGARDVSLHDLPHGDRRYLHPR